MSEVKASNLRSYLDWLGVDLGDGTETGYTKLGRKLNLNAIAIGMGLENIEYEPEKFPGLIYHLENPDTTLLMFSDGTIAFTDAPTKESAEDATATAVERLRELGLLTGDPFDGVTLSKSIAVPSEVKLSKTCDNCGEELPEDGDICPNCGEDIENQCSNCGHDLSGDENFCPNCGREQ